MLMAHSVEGRFPFLDRDVAALANRLPSDYKLRVLDEKHVVKRASRGLVAAEILSRPKQPYRAPDAASFAGANRPDYVEALLAEASVREAGVFEPGAVARLWAKCKAQADGEFSNADNMALTGVLSTQFLHHHFVRSRPAGEGPVTLRTDIDRCNARETAEYARRAPQRSAA
jgi:asparagine synthase (glutamine-hydrolysing)